MNQEKVGALIAKLRKQLNLTQSELGAMVGVGDRAVSKWERGITCPDISIINELSAILGITADELLKGELDQQHKEDIKKKSFNYKLLWLLVPLFLIIGLIVFLNFNKDKAIVYELKSAYTRYDVDGTIIFQNKRTSIDIESITFRDADLNNTIIKNYEYDMLCNNQLLIHSGYIISNELAFEPISFDTFMRNFSINYATFDMADKRVVIKNGLLVRFTYLDVDDNQNTLDIEIMLDK